MLKRLFTTNRFLLMAASASDSMKPATRGDEASLSREGLLARCARLLNAAQERAGLPGTAVWIVTVVAAILYAFSNWFAARLEAHVIANTAQTSAKFMQGLVEPLVQELAKSSTLDEASKSRLDALALSPSFRQHVVEMNIWHPTGVIVHSTDKSLEGLQLAPHTELLGAFDGQVTTEFGEAHRNSVTNVQSSDAPYLEIHAPLRLAGSDYVVAAAEFVVNAEPLAKNLAMIRVQTWTITAWLVATILGLMLLILSRAQSKIQANSEVAKKLSRENEELQTRVSESHRQGAIANERALHRIGADLHDGPAQLLALVLMRLDDIGPAPGDQSAEAAARRATAELVRRAAEDALTEIRGTSRGLILPGLEERSLVETLRLAVTQHEKLTSTSVATTIEELPADVSLPVRVCLYRFVQEGLNNAFKHAGGHGQSLAAKGRESGIVVEISDKGPGFDHGAAAQSGAEPSTGLGLAAMRQRIESLGGVFRIETLPEGGTRLTAVFDRALLT